MSAVTSNEDAEPTSALSIDDRRTASPLPTPLTTLLGRDDDIDRVLALLDDAETRLLTLTGPGGVGKTRLAIEVARQVEPDFANGVCFIALAPIRDPGLILPTVAKALGVPERADQWLLDMLVAALRDRHLLLLLDNFEHLLAEPPGWLVDLLGVCLRLKALVTSRTALHVDGEQRFIVPPLPVPDPPSMQQASEAAAIRLFAQRAHAVNSDFVLDEKNVETIAAICGKLDGLPLAIELAAARAGVLTLAEILSRLTDRFRLLTGGQRNAPARLRSMRDALAWSYDLLSPDEQRFYRHLSVFVGGFTIEAAEEVCGTSNRPAMDALSGLTILLDHSLIRHVDAGAAGPRYTMLETVREFAAEQLTASGEEDELRHRHAMWFLALTATDLSIFHPFQHASHVEVLEADHANLRAALTWLDSSGHESELAELVTRLRWMWYLGAHHAEGVSWHEEVLRTPDDHSITLLCDIARGAGQLAHFNGDGAARGYLKQALELSRLAGDVHREAEAVYHLAIVDEDSGNYVDADEGFRRARRLYDQAPDPWGEATCKYHLGIVAYGLGDLSAASQTLREASNIAQTLNDHLVPMWCRPYHILIACNQRDSQQAIALLDELRRAIRSGNAHVRGVLVASAGVVATVHAAYASAARLLGAAVTFQHDIPYDLPERTAFLDAADLSREHLGDVAFDAAWTEGRRLRPAEIDAEIDRLLSGSWSQPPLPASAARQVAGLTEREVEVLRLLADGLTNAQIAERLYISQRTAATHVRHIFDKLDVTSRSAAVAFAIRNGLA